MSIAAIDQDGESVTARRIRQTAALLPALLIAYSVLIDPLANLGGETSLDYQGFAVEMKEKSTDLARFFIPPLFAAALFLACAARQASSLWQRATTFWLAAFLGLAVVSCAWARNPEISLTLAVYQTMLCATLALAVATARDADRILAALFWLFVVVVAVNLAFVVTRPPGPIGHPGIYPYKNTLGGSATCGLLFALLFLTRGSRLVRLIALGTALGAVYLLHASDSKTAVAMALAAPVLAFALYGAQQLLRIPILVLLVAGTAAALALLAIGSQLFGFASGDILTLVFGEATFTGRTYVWSFIQSHIADQPILGHGYRGFWGIGPDSPKLRAEIEFIRITGSSHNGFLDNLLDLGIVGFVVCLAFIVSIFQAIQRRTMRPAGLTVFYLAVVLFVIGRNLMESVILWSTFFDNLLFILVGFLAGQDQAMSRQPLRSDEAAASTENSDEVRWRAHGPAPAFLHERRTP